MAMFGLGRFARRDKETKATPADSTAENEPIYTDPKYAEEDRIRRAEGHALYQRILDEVATGPARVLMNRCIVCVKDIGPRDETRGQRFCSTECEESRCRGEELRKQRDSYRVWMAHRYGDYASADVYWPGTVER